jgi:hypothetical protein
VHLTLFRILFYLTNFARKGFLMVTWTGFVVTWLIGNHLYAFQTPLRCLLKFFRGSHKDPFRPFAFLYIH